MIRLWPVLRSPSEVSLLHRGLLVAAQVLVVAPRLVFLVVEVLHRLVIEQAVDRARVGARIELVGVPPDADAPLGNEEGEGEVDRHRGEGHGDEAPVELREQHPRHQANSRITGNDREQQVGQQRGHAVGAALDVPRDAAGLALEMEAQGQRVQVAEHGQRELPDRVLGDAHEHGVAQLRKERRGEPQQAVGDKKRKRHRDDGALGPEPVHHLLQHQRHADIGELGRDEAGERDHHAPAVFPQVGQHHGHHPPLAAARRGRGMRQGGGQCAGVRIHRMAGQVYSRALP